MFNFFTSVDSLISKFTKLVTDLEAKAVQHTKAAWLHEKTAAELQAKALFHHDESARATTIAAKIRELVNGD